MTIDTLKRLLAFVVLCLAQALIFNRVQLFHVATPLLYVHFILNFPRHYPKWSLLLWGFFMGLALDMFANTPGVTAFSLTFAAALQPYLLELFIPRDADDQLKVSALTLGWGKYISFATLFTLGYCLLFFSLEAFSFFNWLHWLGCIFGSTLLTMIMITTFESVRK